MTTYYKKIRVPIRKHSRSSDIAIVASIVVILYVTLALFGYALANPRMTMTEVLLNTPRALLWDHSERKEVTDRD